MQRDNRPRNEARVRALNAVDRERLCNQDRKASELTTKAGWI